MLELSRILAKLVRSGLEEYSLGGLRLQHIVAMSLVEPFCSIQSFNLLRFRQRH